MPRSSYRPAAVLGEADMAQYRRALAITKASWIDLYADLFRQVFGEGQDIERVICDAEDRLGIRKANGLLR